MNIERQIIEIIKNNPGVDSTKIKTLLEEKGCPRTYDTISNHLKRMSDEEEVCREAKGSPWTYHYSLPNQRVLSI